MSVHVGLAAALAVLPAATKAPDELVHIFDGDPNWSLCGRDLSSHLELPESADVDCVVCLEIETRMLEQGI